MLVALLGNFSVVSTNFVVFEINFAVFEVNFVVVVGIFDVVVNRNGVSGGNFGVVHVGNFNVVVGIVRILVEFSDFIVSFMVDGSFSVVVVNNFVVIVGFLVVGFSWINSLGLKSSEICGISSPFAKLDILQK